MKKIQQLAKHALLSFLIWSVASLYAADPLPSLAPLNPAFLEYLEKQEQIKAGTLPAEVNYGYRPAPSFYPKVDDSQFIDPPLKALPATYDLRNYNKVTPVRDQGDEGTCWAFATYGSLESCLLTAENWDFSENNMVNLAGFDWGFSDGGNRDMSTAYLARWAGPVRESDDPYPRPGQSPVLAPQKHVQNVYMLPDRSGPTANNYIKQALMDFGALYTTMHAHDNFNNYYNSTSGGYYYDGNLRPNHAVTIVGWDDNYNKNNFKKTPPGNGAFVIRNSWGPGWGKSGYFYISYYDTVVAKETTIFLRPEAANNYLRQYSYDPLGQVNWYGYNTTVAWGANIFTASAAESVRAVSFYLPTPGSRVDVYVYTGCSANKPRSGTLRSSQSSTLTYPGYHTLKLNTPAQLTSGQRFSVVIKYTAPGTKYPIACEYAMPGYSSQAVSSTGKSFISGDGSDWVDVYYMNSTATLCIKAFTGTGVTPPTPPSSGVGMPLLGKYDADRYADAVLYHTNGLWKALLSTYNYAQGSLKSIYAGSQFLPMPGDFDGDGFDDPAVLERSTGYYRFYASRYNYSLYRVNTPWYAGGARNSAGDVDGDGRADLVGYYPPNRTWYVLMSSHAYRLYYYLQWGGPNWIPFCGRIDHDRYGDLIAYNTSDGYWYILLSTENYRRYTYIYFSYSGYNPVVGDVDGDGRTDLGMYNPNTGNWRILLSSTGYKNYVQATWKGY